MTDPKNNPNKAPRQTSSWFEDIVLLMFAVAGFGGGTLLWAAGSAPPIMVALFLGTGVAALVYRFLGGIAPGTSVKIGAFKLGGSLAALLATAWLLDQRLIAESAAEFMLRGTLENLQAEETMASREANLYLRRVYDRNDTFDYEWRLVTPKRLGDGTKVGFFFDRGQRDSKSATRHELTVRSAFYTRGGDEKLRIQYARATDRLFLLLGGNREELKPLEDISKLEPARGTGWLDIFPTLLAQASSVSPELLRRRLESDDPIIRRDARAQLASRGEAALPTIKAILLDPTSSYRSLVGALGAFNEWKGVDAEDLAGTPFKAVLKAVGHQDPSLAAEAFRFFSKYVVAGSASGPATRRQEAIPVRAADAKDGDFRFLLSVAPEGGQVRVSLDQIECYEDSSTGTTRWRFSVFANGSSFAVPERRYGDSPRPQRFATAAADKARLAVTIPTSSVIQLRIVGYKPKHVEP